MRDRNRKACVEEWQITENPGHAFCSGPAAREGRLSLSMERNLTAVTTSRRGGPSSYFAGPLH